MTIETGIYVTAAVGGRHTVTEVSGRVLDVRGDVIELAEGGTVHKEDVIRMGGEV